MVTIAPKEDDWSEAFRLFGQGATQGYQNRADEKALRNAIGDLGENPTPRQILDAVTNTKTHSPQAKQTLLQNYLGVSQFEELQNVHKQQQEYRNVKSDLEKNKATQKKQEEQQKRNNIKSIVNELNLPDDKKQSLGDTLSQETAESLLKEQMKPKKTSYKEEEKIEAMEVGIDTIDEMLSIGKRGNLGRGSGLKKGFGGDTAFDYGMYEQLGKSLIQLSTNIPIRNRQEFETLAHGLYDPTIPDREREGKLNALKGFLERSLKAKDSAEQKPKERPPLSSFERK